MALDWLPAARRAPIAGQPGFPWQVDCPYKGLLHTTEGGNNVPSYTPGFKAPHGTVLPRPGVGVDVVQHIPLNLASYSLMHPSGTPPTNGARVFQWELAGTSEKGGPGLYWPGADDIVLADLYRKVIKPINDAFGVLPIAPQFKAYPASYGAGNGVRLTPATFTSWRGWLGHQHAPGNDHGDPGAFPWARLLEIAHTPPITPEDDMPTLDEIAKLLDAKLAALPADAARAVHSQQIYRATWTGADQKEHPLLFADAILGAYKKAFPTADQVAAAVKTTLASIPAATTNGAVALTDADVARIAKATIDELSTRTVK